MRRRARRAARARAGALETHRPRKEGHQWWATLRFPNGRHLSSSGSTEEEAIRSVEEFRAREERGALEEVVAKAETFAEWCARNDPKGRCSDAELVRAWMDDRAPREDAKRS